MADNDSHVFLFGDAIGKPHVRFADGFLVVSPDGTKMDTYGLPDGRYEKKIPLTTAQARRLAIQLLVALEPEL